MHRERVDVEVDRNVFSHTAAKTKRVNIQPKIMRGGTRF